MGAIVVFCMLLLVLLHDISGSGLHVHGAHGFASEALLCKEQHLLQLTKAGNGRPSVVVSDVAMALWGCSVSSPVKMLVVSQLLIVGC
jgi:hypothetical protein